MADELDGVEGILRAHRRAELEWELQRKELVDRIERLTHRVEQLQNNQRQAEARLRMMIRRLPWGVVLEDSSGRLVLANRRFCDLFRLKVAPEKLEGMDLLAMERNAGTLFLDPDAYVKRLEEIRASSKEALGDTLELASGDIWHRDLVPIETSEGGLGWLHLLQDITSEKRRELELEKAKSVAEEVNRRTSAFLAAMSHEMRTPLSAVLGLAELLHGSVDAESRNLTARITLNAESLLRLIEDVLDFVQLDEGRLRLTEGPLSPREVVQTAADQLAVQVRSKGLKLEVHLDENLPLRVLGDEARIRQLLVGLIGNSLKFTSSGVIRVRAYRPSSGTLDEICYEVEDTGSGIPKDKVHAVFDRFFRVRDDTPGTGLGLSICRDLVHLMGGHIGIDSIEGQGTRAFFILKQPTLAENVPSNLDHVSVRRQSVGPNRDGGLHVLLVEDNVDNRVMMKRFLTKAGYSVKDVDNANDGLRLLRDELFDALVTDISMPGMDGIELVATWRQFEQSSMRNPTPAIVVTAHALPEYRERCREAGVDVFLTKPIKGAILCRALAKVTQEVARVLVVDDSPDSRLLLRLCLEQYPFPLDIVVASSGPAAIEACSTQKFSIVFLDAWMPEMSGVETLAKIRETLGHTQVPAIAVTALTEDHEIEKLKQNGFTQVLLKPIDRRAVIQAVRDHLRAATVLSHPILSGVTLGSSTTSLQLEAIGQSGTSSRQEEEFVVSVDSDIRDLVPTFLKNRRADLEKIRAFEKEKRFEEVRRIGHGMKGTGSAYGFEPITEIGARLEVASRSDDGAEILSLCQELESFLDKVRIENAALSRLPGAGLNQDRTAFE